MDKSCDIYSICMSPTLQAKQHVKPFPKEAQRTYKDIGEMT
jgi:hypothetical protein